MSTRYRYQIQRLSEYNPKTGYHHSVDSYEPWDGVVGHYPKPYPLFDNAKSAEAFIRRRKLIARWQRYAVNPDGSLGWTAGAGAIIDARKSPRRRRGRR